MNKGVEILLSRMESNPDEFFIHNKEAAKWRDIVEQVYNRADVIHKNPDAQKHWAHLLHFLSDEEILELHNKLQSIRAEEFTQDVMKRLLDEDGDDRLPYKTRDRYAIGWENIKGQLGSGNYHQSGSLGNTPNDQHYADQLKAQTDMYQAQIKSELEKLRRPAKAIK